MVPATNGAVSFKLEDSIHCFTGLPPVELRNTSDASEITPEAFAKQRDSVLQQNRTPQKRVAAVKRTANLSFMPSMAHISNTTTRRCKFRQNRTYNKKPRIGTYKRTLRIHRSTDRLSENLACECESTLCRDGPGPDLHNPFHKDVDREGGGLPKKSARFLKERSKWVQTDDYRTSSPSPVQPFSSTPVSLAAILALTATTTDPRTR